MNWASVLFALTVGSTAGWFIYTTFSSVANLFQTLIK